MQNLYSHTTAIPAALSHLIKCWGDEEHYLHIELTKITNQEVHTSGYLLTCYPCNVRETYNRHNLQFSTHTSEKL